MSKVAVWINNYGNEKHLVKCIESVLSQTYRNFVLFIFDNHSPSEEVQRLIKSYASNYPGRVVNMEPLTPKGLAGIPHMDFAWSYLNKLDFDYSITLGGHDYWPNEGHLELLVNRMDQENAVDPVALIYVDTWQVNEEDQLIGRFGNFLQQGGNMAKPFIPQWVVGGIDCTPLFGLWNEAVRKQVRIRHLCAGWDHLVVAHAGLKGRILYEPRTAFIMRAPPPGDGPDNYAKRHFGPEAQNGKHQDFINQIEWLNTMVDEACDGEPSFKRMMLTVSMFSMYVCLRGYNLGVFPGGLQAFNSDPRAIKALKACIEAAQAVQYLTHPA